MGQGLANQCWASLLGWQRSARVAGSLANKTFTSLPLPACVSHAVKWIGPTIWPDRVVTPWASGMHLAMGRQPAQFGRVTSAYTARMGAVGGGSGCRGKHGALASAGYLHKLGSSNRSREELPLPPARALRQSACASGAVTASLQLIHLHLVRQRLVYQTGWARRKRD